jgi:hypothetical protein
MTPVAVVGQPQILSRLSVAALEDLGYQVDYNGADKFTAANLGPGAICNNRLRFLQGSWKQLGWVQAGRKLISDELRQYAIQRGEAILEENKKLNQYRKSTDEFTAFKSYKSMAAVTFQPPGIFVPVDSIVSVVVRDQEGNVFSVLVTGN